jgi:hypothetical protein
MPEYEACGLVERNFNGNRTSFSLPNVASVGEEITSEDVGGVKNAKEDGVEITSGKIDF